MKTEVWSLGTPDDDHLLREAAHRVKAGQLVAFPTETVYGIGALPGDKDLLGRIFGLKGREAAKLCAWHLSCVDKIKQLPIHLESNPKFDVIAKQFLPGPLTALLNSKEGGIVGIRVPDCPAASQFIEEAGGVLLATSANLSGAPSPCSADDVRQSLDGKIDLILDGGKTSFQGDSTVVDFTQEPFKIIRPGVYSALRLELENIK